MFLKCRARVLVAGLAWSAVAGCAVGRPAPMSQRATLAVPRAAGVPIPHVPRPAAEPASSLGGTVVSEVDRAPLGRARVVLRSPALAAPRAAMTRADGRYRFDHLPAGSYVAGVTRSGYAPQEYGARRAAPAEPVVLGDTQSRTDIDFVLAPAGVITGIILDEDGNPFAGASVEALVSRTNGGQAALVTMARAQSDDRGDFRLTGLAAGRYYVSALDPAFASVGDETGPLHYTPTFYPGVVLVEEAARVSVSPAGPAVPITFTLRIVRPARVSGVMTAHDRRQLLNGSLVMMPTEVEGLLAIAAPDIRILPDGSFVARDVPPGRYQIRARGEVDPDGVALFATYRVMVDGHDISNVDMTLLPGALVMGKMTAEAGQTPKPAGLRVRAPLADGTTAGDALTGDVQADGSYSIRGLMPGRHMITVEGLRYPWVVKRVTSQGQDITDSGVEVDSRQRFDNVVVTIADQASDISGLVRAPGGEAVADATVLFLPLAEQFWIRTSPRLGMVRSDANGRYRMRGLPPGEYRAVASANLDESDVHRTGLLRDLSDAGIPLTIAGVEARTLDVPLTSLDTLRRTSSR